MWEFLVVIISFMSIPFLSKKNVPIGVALCICAALMGLLGGLNFLAVKDVLSSTFLDIAKVQRYLIIAEIGILGALLKKYNLIDDVIKYTVKVTSNKRIILGSIPALIGLLSVPGGAIMSVPFVDKLGGESGLSPNHKAIINLVYRHIVMPVLPYDTSFLVLTSLVPQISLYKLIGLNSIFIVLYGAMGYYLYLRPIDNDTFSNNPNTEPILPNLLKLLLYTAPVYLAVILNVLFNIPFYIGMIANFMMLYILRPTKTFLPDMVQSFNVKILLALVGVYLIQGVIEKFDSISALLSLIFNSPQTILLGIAFISLFFGLTTGFQPTALGIVLPILVTLPITNNRLLLYSHFTYVLSFMGYYFSPLHLCQLFTCEYLEIPAVGIYKDYWKFFLGLAVIAIANYFLLSLWLK